MTLTEIPSLEYIRSLIGFEDKNTYLIKVTKNTSPGAWYKSHIGEIFLVKKGNWNSGAHDAIACLTKFVKPSEWEYVLSGWFDDSDCIRIDENNFLKIFNREKKLKELLCNN